MASRYTITPDGGFAPAPVTGPGPQCANWQVPDRYHYASRTGKYPVHDPRTQELPAESMTEVPTLWPGLFGWLKRSQRSQLMSRANLTNPAGEWLGNTIYDGFMKTYNPVIAGQSQNLIAKPLQNPTTVKALGYQDPQKMLDRRGTPAGEKRYAP